MVDLIVPSDISERLSKDSGRKIIVKRMYTLERLREYRYTFDLLVDDFPKLYYVDVVISQAFQSGSTTIWKTIYNQLLSQIKEAKNG